MEWELEWRVAPPAGILLHPTISEPNVAIPLMANQSAPPNDKDFDLTSHVRKRSLRYGGHAGWRLETRGGAVGVGGGGVAGWRWWR